MVVKLSNAAELLYFEQQNVDFEIQFQYAFIMDACCIHFGTMATLTIKNLPDELYAELTRMAKKNRRSINNEAIVSLEKALETPVRETEAVLDRIRKDRKEMTKKGIWLTDQILEKAKNEGRP